MKKVLWSLLIVAIGAGIVCANTYGGFQDKKAKTSVADALKLPDNAYVNLQGNIIKRITDDEYLFKDATGSINVEIDNNKWMGQIVNPNDTVEITGEIEKKFNSTKIDVDSINKLSK